MFKNNSAIFLLFTAFLFIPILAKAESGANDLIIIQDRRGFLHSTPLQIYLRPDQDGMPLGDSLENGQIHLHLNGGPAIPLDLANFSIANQILLAPKGLALGNELALKGEKNEGTIRLTLNGTQILDVPLRVFFWKWTDKLVISDIDGTITRHDLMDLLMPSMDWTYTGVKALYEKIAGQGYKMVYLTARPLSLANQTQNYLAKVGIPSGPILLSPSNFLDNLEVMAEPTEYKAKCLHGMKRLFPRHARPFQAGLGNAETDKLAYERVNIPYIFIVASDGEVTLHQGGIGNGTKRGDRQVGGLVPMPLDYERMAENVQFYFPKLIVERQLR